MDLMDAKSKQGRLKRKMSDKENMNTTNTQLPPKTPNYGKTPKYLSKYKDEAKIKNEVKEE